MPAAAARRPVAQRQGDAVGAVPVDAAPSVSLVSRQPLDRRLNGRRVVDVLRSCNPYEADRPSWGWSQVDPSRALIAAELLGLVQVQRIAGLAPPKVGWPVRLTARGAHWLAVVELAADAERGRADAG